MKMNMHSPNLFLVMLVVLFGIVHTVVSQSLPEPLFNRGCRASRGQFPHETFCQQYYNCWDGRATIEECPGKLLFNPVISACDYPEAVNCGARLRNPEPAVTTDGRCLKQFGIFPDQTDCTAFYKCSHGRAYRQICPYYTAFDDRYLVCVHAYEVECGGRGGVYGTLAPPTFNIPVGGTAARIDLPPGSGSSSSGWDRRSSHESSGSSAGGSQSHPNKGSAAGAGGRRGGPGRVAGTRGTGSHGNSRVASGNIGTGGSATSGHGAGSTSTSGSNAGITSGTGGATSGTSSSNVGGSSGRGTSGSNASGRGANSPGTSGGTTGTRGGTGSSSGTHAGITGIVDKDISATGQERQYERPISPEATFRCPHPRGLYPNALDCSRFWLCREYKPSLLKCPTGQLFDLASLSCTNPEKTQCSSISPRT